MEDSSTEMLGPRGNDETFGFGFNDLDFSDRVLHIEITPVHSNDDSHCSDEVEVKSLHITSLILAAKSPFFYKLFKNGMKESQSKDVTLRISSSEKTSFMDMLKFMYSNTLTAATNPDLLEILMLADKFVDSSCTKYCVQLLLKNPMSVESAVSFLELPSNVLVAESVQPLIDAASLCLFAHFGEFNNSLEEVMKLPLAAVECILGRGDLQVESEDDVFNFVLKWVHAHYPNPEERREIVTNRLVQLICFPYMSHSKLKEVLVCPEFDHEVVSKLIIEALFYKAQIFSGEHVSDSTECGYDGHLYLDRAVKVEQLGHSQPRCVFYFDLDEGDCKCMNSVEHLYSQPFFLGGLWFSLCFKRRKKKHSLFEHFSLFLRMSDGPVTCTVKLVVEVMKKSSNKFESLVVGNNFKFDRDKGWLSAHVWLTPWTTFISNGSKYFIDKKLRFRVDITIVN